MHKNRGTAKYFAARQFCQIVSQFCILQTTVVPSSLNSLNLDDFHDPTAFCLTRFCKIPITEIYFHLRNIARNARSRLNIFEHSITMAVLHYWTIPLSATFEVNYPSSARTRTHTRGHARTRPYQPNSSDQWEKWTRSPSPCDDKTTTFICKQDSSSVYMYMV